MSSSPTAAAWPARSIEECHALMQQPGAMWETELVSIKGEQRKVFKNLPKSIRDLWLAISTVRFSPERFPLMGQDLTARLQTYAKRDYIVYQNERYTYEQAATRSAAIAELLRRRGVVKGDRGASNLSDWNVHLRIN